MVDLTDEDGVSYPVLSILRYQFDQSYWNRMPGVSDHWIFNRPFYEEEFEITHTENEWTIFSNDKLKKKYSGFERLKAIDMPLFDVRSPEDVGVKIFEGFKELEF